MASRNDEVQGEVAAIGNLSRSELIGRWTKIYGHAPPKGARQELLAKVVAWHWQARRLGGYSAETRRLLKAAISRVESEILAHDRRTVTSSDLRSKAAEHEIADVNTSHAKDAALPLRQRRKLTPGARLVREWNGKTCVVDVIEGGYVFEAKVYPSLSAIASRITGAHWSGPRFFGI